MILFTAEWCQPCKQVKKYINERMIKLKVLDITTEEGTNQARDFNIRNIPALHTEGSVVVFGAENIIKYLKGKYE